MIRKIIEAMVVVGIVTVSGSSYALDVLNKEEVIKALQVAIEKGKAGDANGYTENASQAKKLARDSIKERHSFVMQVALDHIKADLELAKQGKLADAVKDTEETLERVTAQGKDTMTN